MADSFLIEVFPLGPLQTNCTILINKTQKKAVIFDPGMGASQLIARMEAHEGIEVSRIWLTHAHWDHIGGLEEFRLWAEKKQGSEIPVHLHPGDEPIFVNAKIQAQEWGIPPFEVPKTFYRTKTSDVYPELPSAQVLYTPGHSPGSCSLYINADYEVHGSMSLFRGLESSGKGFVIAGDVLFRGSVGRTDLWQGSYEQLEASIKKKLYTLPGQTLVITGHGPMTDIEQEQAHNQVVRL